jgi:hypothetical protein
MADHKPTGEELQMADIRTIIELENKLVYACGLGKKLTPELSLCTQPILFTQSLIVISR